MYKISVYEKYFKRLTDLILSLLGLFFLSPILIVVALLVKLKLGSPVIFKQKRPGKNEKIFTMYKFRTMTNELDEFNNLLPDSDRLTKFGKFLRSTSLDELPELTNIIRGDMSIIGPRPQLIKDMLFMSEEHRTRHNVRPGLSGLAQISGRNAVTWEQKLKKDIEYINEIRFIKDIYIIILTIIKIIIRSDINSEGCETSFDYGDYLLENKSISKQEYMEVLKNYKRVKEKSHD